MKKINPNNAIELLKKTFPEKPKIIAPATMPNQDSLGNMMDKFNEMQSKNETVEVIKQLFDHSKIKKITDLTSDAINLVVAIDTVAETKGIEIFSKITDKFIELQISKGRKSRKEVIEAIKGHAALQQGPFDKMRNVFSR